MGVPGGCRVRGRCMAEHQPGPLGWNGIDAALVPRMATQHAPRSQPQAPPRTMSRDRLHHVVGAARVVAACRWQQWRHGKFVGSQDQDQGSADQMHRLSMGRESPGQMRKIALHISQGRGLRQGRRHKEADVVGNREPRRVQPHALPNEALQAIALRGVAEILAHGNQESGFGSRRSQGLGVQEAQLVVAPLGEHGAYGGPLREPPPTGHPVGLHGRYPVWGQTTDRRLRPLARRRLIVRRPPRDFIRLRNPCTFIRRRAWG